MFSLGCSFFFFPLEIASTHCSTAILPPWFAPHSLYFSYTPTLLHSHCPPSASVDSSSLSSSLPLSPCSCEPLAVDSYLLTSRLIDAQLELELVVILDNTRNTTLPYSDDRPIPGALTALVLHTWGVMSLMHDIRLHLSCTA